MDEQKNFILAIALSMLVIFGYQYFMPDPPPPPPAAETEAQDESTGAVPTVAAETGSPTLSPATSTLSADEAIAASRRIIIDSAELSGSISLTGLLIDDVMLRNHKETMEEDADNIHIFNPARTENAYFGRVGWAPVPNQQHLAPDDKTVWTADRDVLSEDSPVTLTWDNGEGQVFTTRISIDDRFLFTIEQSVTSNGGADSIILAPFALISRQGVPDTMDNFILHEGLVGVFDGELADESWDDMEDDPSYSWGNVSGWLGMTDKYWLSALIPANGTTMQNAEFSFSKGRYQVSYLEGQDVLTIGGTLSSTSHLFAGAKLVDGLEHYEAQGFTDFTKAIDWGMYSFLTRPFFWLLDQLYKFSGNFGVAILLLTVLIKLAMFPIANKQFRSMSRMKKVAPKMKALQERYKDDKPKLQQEMMALYSKEKVNPMSGCLPILIQIPVFFALYKVLFVTIEMRHQPFFGWIQDMAAPDPLLFINLFGLIPWEPTGIFSFLAIGVWPVIMGLTMWAQQKLSPQAGDPTQQAVMKWLPVIFTFILGQFAAGLVIYWTFNNVLTIAQQYVIMRREGVSINEEQNA